MNDSLKVSFIICAMVAAEVSFGGCGYGYEGNPIGVEEIVAHPVIMAVDPDPDDPNFCMCGNEALGPVVITYSESVFGALDASHYIFTRPGEYNYC